MDLKQHLLGKMAEESAEIGQIALKTQQFGFKEKHPDLLANNAQRIHAELDDLAAIVEMLNSLGLGYKPSRSRIDSKKNKVARYLLYSVELGKVDKKALADFQKNIYGN